MRVDEITEGESRLRRASRNEPWKDSIFRDRKESKAKKGNSEKARRMLKETKKRECFKCIEIIACVKYVKE